MTETTPGSVVRALERSIRDSGEHLHGVASRSEPGQIAAEVLRLNDAVRTAAEHRMPDTDPPGGYLQALLRLADDFDGAPHVR